MFAFRILILFGAWFYFSQTGSFVTVIQGTPLGSKFYVDESGWGVPSVSNEYKLYDLKAGQRKIKIVHPNFNCIVIHADGKDGETGKYPANCEPANRTEVSEVIAKNRSMRICGKIVPKRFWMVLKIRLILINSCKR